MLSDPFLLGGERAAGTRAADADLKEAVYDETIASWTAPFTMAPINTRIVRRSVAMLEDRKISPFSSDFSYAECIVAPSEEVIHQADRSTVPFQLLLAQRSKKWLIC